MKHGRNTEKKQYVEVVSPAELRSTVAALDCDGTGDAIKQYSTSLQLYVRSVGGVISFIGALVRGQLGLDEGREDVRMTERNGQGNLAEVLFSVSRGIAGRELSFTYDGTAYHIEADPTGRRDHSAQVLKIVEELQALNSSAKSFPIPNAVNLIGR